MTQTNEEAVCTKAAYVLFYQRRWDSTYITSQSGLRIFRPHGKSKKNIPAAAGSAENQATSSSLGHNGNLVNGDSTVNGVSDEDMEVN